MDLLAQNSLNAILNIASAYFPFKNGELYLKLADNMTLNSVSFLQVKDAFQYERDHLSAPFSAEIEKLFNNDVIQPLNDYEKFKRLRLKIEIEKGRPCVIVLRSVPNSVPLKPYPEIVSNLTSLFQTYLNSLLKNEAMEKREKEQALLLSQLEEEKLYLQQEVSSAYAFSDIIGSGTEMKEIYEQMSQVAFANSTVLILGETGTGKELIARGIHKTSSRKDKLMVKVNCAAIPENLIESELFGHEKGSFTGAVERRIGKFELANGGTLFLDEIGEMPFDLQVKLLRAIQEKEIERIGGRTVIKVNVRIIAATNRDLLKEVQDGNFRSDLYYRINVFPITLPALRDRKEDIPALTSYFINRFSRNAGKKVNKITSSAMKDLVAYDWPGNVRELEHLIERTILVSKGDIIKEVHLPSERKTANTEETVEYIKTNAENEKDHILYVLKKTNGKIYGRGGAAELLDMHVSTLNSRIRKLGIKKQQLFS